MSEFHKSPIEVTTAALDPYLTEYGLQLAADGLHIQWGKGNPRHPRNWSLSRKIYDGGLVMFLELFTTAISTAGSTCANKAAGEFGIQKELSIFFFVSLSV
ncbi:hypothetical protein EYZ11_013137 [Aspergillus tanneri]|uniref:Uncharacterized protein n=1 Tax=Aspergillus tanneri TaxID=1220188 RepID=A0A4S3IYP2_9EURO|nr:hypothetical protein EYZ11_013137 [Aspergillus tanneri]